MSVYTAAKMLTQKHVDHLAQFHIPSEMLEAANVQSVTDAEAREILGLHGHRGADLRGILFPYLSPFAGTRVGGRVRLDHPLVEDHGKYISEPGCRHLFFAPVPEEWLVDTSIPADIRKKRGEKWSVMAILTLRNSIDRGNILAK